MEQRPERATSTERVPLPSGMVELGYIADAHGIKGEVKVKLHNPTSETLATVKSVLLFTSDGESQPVKLVWVKGLGSDLVRLRLEGFTDRDQAQSLTGCRVVVPVDVLPPAGEDEFYHLELMGMDVVDEAGQVRGQISQIYDTAAHDIYEVHCPDGAEILVPAVSFYVQSVDRATRRVVIHHLDDLR